MLDKPNENPEFAHEDESYDEQMEGREVVDGTTADTTVVQHDEEVEAEAEAEADAKKQRLVRTC